MLGHLNDLNMNKEQQEILGLGYHIFSKMSYCVLVQFTIISSLYDTLLDTYFHVFVNHILDLSVFTCAITLQLKCVDLGAYNLNTFQAA